METDILYLEETPETPKVLFNKTEGIFELSGRSLPEDSVTFYTPVIAWIRQYAKSPNPSTVFNCRLEYFNTASSKLIFDLISSLGEINGIKIIWHYDADDEDILETGKEFSEQIDVPFDFRPIH